MVAALVVGSALGACFHCPHSPGPPLEAGLFESGPVDTFGGLPVDDRLSVEVDPENDSVVVTFSSEGRAVEQRYRIVDVDDGS